MVQRMCGQAFVLTYNLLSISRGGVKMIYIIIRRDNWFGLEIVTDCYTKPKQFQTEDEAINYINTMDYDPANAEVISVHI
jgi:hypothetical protein